MFAEIVDLITFIEGILDIIKMDRDYIPSMIQQANSSAKKSYGGMGSISLRNDLNAAMSGFISLAFKDDVIDSDYYKENRDKLANIDLDKEVDEESKLRLMLKYDYQSFDDLAKDVKDYIDDILLYEGRYGFYHQSEFFKNNE